MAHNGNETNSRDRMIFWCLVAAQAAGSQAIIWTALPVYRRLLSHDTSVGGPKTIAMTLLIVAAMQAAYWFNYRLQPGLQFRQNRFVGHLLECLGELCYFFPSAFAAVVIFDLFGELAFDPVKVFTLAATLFASFCYKKQLESLGNKIENGAVADTKEQFPDV